MKKITVRRAAAADAPIIAAALAMALGEDAVEQYCGKDYLSVLEELARMEQSQYSYRHALVAEADGVTAGAVVGYDGARLQELKEPTLQLIRRRTGRMPALEDETGPGEFYLDSVGVLPEFRGCGVGSRLLVALRDKALSEGHGRIGLLVDRENPSAERLYLSLGFRRIAARTFLGHAMWHLQYVSQP